MQSHSGNSWCNTENIKRKKLEVKSWLAFIFYSKSRTLTAQKKWSFTVRISLVNVTKSTVYYRFGHIHWRFLNRDLHFLCSVFHNVDKFDQSFSKLKTGGKVTHLLYGSPNNTNALNWDVKPLTFNFIKKRLIFIPTARNICLIRNLA